MIEIAMFHHMEQETDPQTLLSIRAELEQNDWDDVTGRVYRAVRDFLKPKVDLNFRFFTQKLGNEANPGCILAFCSNVSLPEDANGKF